ncbi:GDP-mannose 4,6-dehydratase [Arthrobacter sp. ZGTC412]|uniref:GDP-mannose 4,6-dehydratase n=1 Tax=Arthrobacter sp. ZGTC412 TaxID=2058900 RepID=UPI002157204F|nr:GDP-mannose 4,6-dehydratase [Arthrobacter sp. ZGTC412]
MTFASNRRLAADMPIALVTGFAGQDGQYLAERLLQDNWTVHATISPRPMRADSERVVPLLHTVDLSVPGNVPPLLDEVQPDVIFNLAGISSVARSWEEPAATIAINGVGASSLLEAAWQRSTRTDKGIKFIQASSAEIFGHATDVPQHEASRIQPVSPYGASKAFAHQLVGVYRERGMFASSAILYNHESPLRSPAFVTRKITSQVARIALGFDERLRLGNTEVRRDWGWAPDYVDAMIKMALHSRADDFVIATGKSHTVGDFVRLAFEAAGVERWENLVEFDERFARPADPVEMRGDATKAQRELGWHPTVSFDDIVKRMVEYDMSRERSRMAPVERETGR